MKSRYIIVPSSIISILVSFTAASAWAPSPISIAHERQTTLGYKPCKPVVSSLPNDKALQNILADADNGIQSGNCEIRIASTLTDADLEWVAWHEMCHLSTLHDINNNEYSTTLNDPAHTHPFFRQCLKFGPQETGGY